MIKTRVATLVFHAHLCLLTPKEPSGVMGISEHNGASGNEGLGLGRGEVVSGWN